MLKFIPKFLKIVLHIVSNGIVFSISILVCLCYCIEIQLIVLLILYLVTLMNTFISSTSFLLDSLEFFYTTSCHLWIEIALLLPFLSRCILFLLFSLIYLTTTSTTMLNRIGDKRYLCLTPEHWEKSFHLPLLSMMLALGLP